GITRSSLYALALGAQGFIIGPAPIFAGADDDVSGGIFVSNDAGANWFDISNGIPDSRVHALETASVHPDVSGVLAYVGTRSLGVFKGLGSSFSPTSLNNVFITTLARASPSINGIIYAGTDAN